MAESRDVAVMLRGVLLAGLLVCAVSGEGEKKTGTTAKPAPVPDHKKAAAATFFGRAMCVQTIEEEPYVMKKGGKLVGFIPDLLSAVEQRSGVRFGTPTLAKKCYGDKSPATCGCGEGADLAAAALTITSRRETVVDFVKPFAHLGLTILVKKPHFNPEKQIHWPANFSVFYPLSDAVWALVILACVVVGLTLWLMNKFNPYEWAGRYNLGHASQSQSEMFSLSGSLWFALTTMQWQGFERSPRSVASKMLTVFWFLFVTIFLATYIGSIVNNLFWASSVHSRDPTKPAVLDLEDLVKHHKINYGVVEGGSTYQYLTEVAQGAEFDRIRAYWNTSHGKEMLVHSTAQGIKRVQKGNYAFIMESMSAKHVINNVDCTLTTVGETFGLRSYGFALPHNSALRKALNQALLELQESGELDYLERKWWVDRGLCWNLTQAEKTIRQSAALFLDKPKRVNLQMFAGPLVLILVGVVLSYLTALAEILYFKYHGRYQSGNRPGGQQLKLDDEPDGNI